MVHSFHQELFVMRKEEEAATLTRTFSRFKDCIPIIVNIQGFQEWIGWYSIHLKDLLELFFFVACYFELDI